MSLLDRLQELAEQATSGPWEADGSEIYQRDDHDAWIGETLVYGDDDQTERNSAYIAAVDPQTVLRLIAVTRAAERLLAETDHRSLNESFVGDFCTCVPCVGVRVALDALEGPTS